MSISSLEPTAPAPAPARPPARGGRPPSHPRKSWTPTATSPTTAVSFPPACSSPLPLRGCSRSRPRPHSAPLRSRSLRHTPHLVAVPGRAVRSPRSQHTQPLPRAGPRGGKFGGAPWGCPISSGRLPGARAAPPLGPPAGSPSVGGGFCSLAGRSCAPGRHQLLPAARSLPAPEHAADRPRSRGSGWAKGGETPGPESGGLPGGPAAAERGGLTGARAEDQGTMGPACPLEKPWWFLLPRSLVPPLRSTGPPTFAHLLHPLPRPVRAPTPTPASCCGQEPRAPGNRQAPGPPGPTPGWLVLLASFWAPRVVALAAPPAPGLEGKPRTPRSPCGAAGWIYAGWGRGRRQRCSPGPCLAVAPAASLSELENPSPTPVLREVWTFLRAGVARPLRRGSPGPIPHAAQRRRLRLARVPPWASAWGSGVSPT